MKSSVDYKFKECVQFILNSEDSSLSDDRTGTGTLKNPILPQMLFDMRDGFPLLGLKKTSFRNVFHELKWFISGDTNIKYLLKNDCNIWNANAYDYYKKLFKEYDGAYMSMEVFLELAVIGQKTSLIQPNGKEYVFGDLGNVYGKQWRGGHNDQLADAIKLIRNNPNSRRIIVDSWNPSDMNKRALPPCHVLFQFLVHGIENEKLSINVYMRSNDIMIGAPYNIASYALLLEIVAAITGKEATFLKYNVGDAHIYKNHLDSAKLILNRECSTMPNLIFKNGRKQYNDCSIEDFNFEHFSLEGYNPHPSMKLKMSV